MNRAIAFALLLAVASAAFAKAGIPKFTEIIDAQGKCLADRGQPSKFKFTVYAADRGQPSKFKFTVYGHQIHKGHIHQSHNGADWYQSPDSGILSIRPTTQDGHAGVWRSRVDGTEGFGPVANQAFFSLQTDRFLR